ncbi:putative RNA recognition motif domain, nucleotide-binding alpha-beta plait domain superfamily [Helianthus annuus]|nr:putative RNA recognition motif domain, nucleotide-binding alpha-beta plait domain superfamily [Helianthus annuus]KAJ0748071.1 putative RNA recognition motif domain, nucleotide-binding alpha-beta plait domain superfamily [Helianthus annuus]
MGEVDIELTKFFVSNLPEQCSSLELGDFFGTFGDVVGVYVARKRDKNGNRFGFVTFKGVRDKKEMEGRLKGAKLGESKLWVNVARFAVENASLAAYPGVKFNRSDLSGPLEWNKVFNIRDNRSYSDVGSCSGVGNAVAEKMVVVPDRMSAYKELHGLAVVGRTTDLETLVDFNRLMKIAKFEYSRLQYLGGLSILISFTDEASAARFLESSNIWGP